MGDLGNAGNSVQSGDKDNVVDLESARDARASDDGGQPRRSKYDYGAIARLIEEGRTASEIRQEFEGLGKPIGTQTPYNVARFYGLELKSSRRKSDYEAVATLIREGRTASEIVEELGVPRKTPYNVAAALKLELTDERGSRQKGEKPGEVEEQDPNVAIAHEMLSRQPEGSKGTLSEIYRANSDEIKIPVVDIRTKKPSANVLFLSELLLGHQHADIDFFICVVDGLKELPEEMKPDVIVMSGLLQGDFKFLEKRRRGTLVPELTSMGEQFRYGRQMLDKLLETGIPLVYNMSNDDRRIAEEYTIEVFRKMQKYAVKKGDSADRSLAQSTVNWGSIDKMRMNSQWNTHLDFQINVVFPYCLRAGRRLRSADEMREFTGGRVQIEEYFLLFGAIEKLKLGKRLSKTQKEWLDIKALKDTSFTITDDVDIRVRTNGKEYTDRIRHNMGFSQQPMYGNHMNVMIEAMGQMKAAGMASHNFNVTEHSQEAVGVDMGDGMWVISTGGLIRPGQFLEAKGSKGDIPGDVSRRLVTTRRRIPSPVATAHERTDDGRHIVTVFNKTLTDRSASLPERMSIVLISDWQTGSPTARADYQAKFMDYVHSKILKDGPIAMLLNGDMVQGRNYPDFPSESQITGLMSMDSQVDFVSRMLAGTLEDLTKEQVRGIERVVIGPGNHEWNSGTVKWHGYTFVDYLKGVYDRVYARNGYADKQIDDTVRIVNGVITPKGEFLKSWTGFEYFGENGILMQHFPLERGAKGNSGGLPVYQVHSQLAGLGSLMESVDYEMFGHWHHPHYAAFGDKVAIVNGSLAGLSGYEFMRGYRPILGATILHIGGGLPPQIEFVSEEALINHAIKEGRFSDKELAREGFRTDRGFDPVRHGPFMEGYPKSALQKALIREMRDASASTSRSSEIRLRKAI